MKKKLEPPPVDFDESPEWTEQDFDRAVPFAEMFPAQVESWKRQRGRPPLGREAKVYIGFRLSADVAAGVRASGKGYNARVEKILREALAKGLL